MRGFVLPRTRVCLRESSHAGATKNETRQKRAMSSSMSSKHRLCVYSIDAGDARTVHPAGLSGISDLLLFGMFVFSISTFWVDKKCAVMVEVVVFFFLSK